MGIEVRSSKKNWQMNKACWFNVLQPAYSIRQKTIFFCLRLK
ncbi:hypothetical protein D020_1841 [Vibrio parahaemolyticus SBR10290]|nr:hypothetical protein D021_3473 [Vibrio parahaemolyticus 10296]ESW42793.1 hypothetical protein D022_3407 [Vibrio parahaemolyticus 12310]ETT19921.1 hypothetical protein D023_3414 [Vibrio parahaemolyticus 3256]ETX55935.1 hypothetical protein D020_1841 [Vibrio parahaemolyticus SBR10290]